MWRRARGLGVLAAIAVLVAGPTVTSGQASSGRASSGVAPAGPRAGTELPAKVIDQNFPDPEVYRDGDTYYAYATNTDDKNVPVASAPSMDGPWTVHDTDVLPELGAWAVEGRTWAPDVTRLDNGTYLLYYTARNGEAVRPCIGAAVADSPTGPFEPVGTEPLVCNLDGGGAIDAASFVDTDGQRYLLYKDNGNAVQEPTSILLQAVADDGVTFTGDPVELIRNGPYEGNLVEAPVLRIRDGRYVLMYAIGYFLGPSYTTKYAIADEIAGPYTKHARPVMSTDSFDGRIVGPGGTDFLRDKEGVDHVVFHGVVAERTRAMFVGELGWANGHPIVRGSRTRWEAESGTVHNCRVRETDTGASGGRVVAYMDHADSYVDLEVYAPRSGGYTLRAGYANGSKDSGGAEQTATHRVSVNGSDAGEISYPYTGWGNWQPAALDVELQEGWNTVRFQHGDWYAELDYIDVA